MKSPAFFSLNTQSLSYLLICLTLSLSAQATIVIDDFTTTQSVPVNTFSYVQGTGIIGSERDVRTFLDVNVGINTTYSNQLHTTNTDDFGHSFFITYDGQDGDADPYNPDEDGLGHLDLTESGQNTGFLISFSQGSSNGDYLLMTIGQGDKISEEIFDLPSSASDIFVPFSDFGSPITSAPPQELMPAPEDRVDFTDVGYVRFLMRLGPYSSCAIDSITVVPEPATLVLLAVGGLILSKRKLLNT